jgi:isoleucyl-tRNA synthetase
MGLVMYGFSINLLLSNLNYSAQDTRKFAYGADVLRLWAATVEYWKDVSIGPTVIAQVAESLRKLRNSARFCLANLGPPDALAKMERVPMAEMGYVRRLIVLSSERDSLIRFSSFAAVG